MSSPLHPLLGQPGPATSLAPSFYASKPHHRLHASERVGFRSPWPSAASHGFLNFLRARLTEWDEKPLPPSLQTGRWTRTFDAAWGEGDAQSNVHAPGSLGTSQLGVVATWLGHASVHLQLPLTRTDPTTQAEAASSSPTPPPRIAVLTDPVFSRRCSPFQFLGPSRFTPCPTSVERMAMDEREQRSKGGHLRIWPDAVLISHNHYDHLDANTISELVRHSQPSSSGDTATAPASSSDSATRLAMPRFFCPLGVRSTLESFGVPAERITEGDWWERFDFAVPLPPRPRQGASSSSTATGPAAGEAEAEAEAPRTVKVGFTLTPAQHFSGRGLRDRDASLWAGWMVHIAGAGPGDTPTTTTASPPLNGTAAESVSNASDQDLRVYFAGDSGLRSVPRGVTPGSEHESSLPRCPAFGEIRAALGRPHLSLVPIGAFEPRSVMSGVHMNPEDAVLAHRALGSARSLGIHWGTFRLTPEEVSEAPERLERLAKVPNHEHDDGQENVASAGPFECICNGQSLLC